MVSANTSAFRTPHSDFKRVSSVSPELALSNVAQNVQILQTTVTQLDAEGVNLVIFPELALTGYSCGDLFFQNALLTAAREGLLQLREASKKWACVVVVGLPLVFRGRLYNCGAALQGGKILGVVPKTFLPARYEYYEPRWFTSGGEIGMEEIELGGEWVPFGVQLLFESKQDSRFTFGIEICEDLWAVNPPSGNMALAGATIIANLSASDELLGKVDYRRNLVVQQSARCLSGYVYAGAGPCESTTDVVFSGHSLIAENGKLLAESERFVMDTQRIVADFDVDFLTSERLKHGSFSQGSVEKSFTRIPFNGESLEPKTKRILRPIERLPFVPSSPEDRAKYCREIVQIQSTGLAQRLRYTKLRDVIIGVSGGLDSTLALIVCIEAFHKLSLDLKGIHAISLPGLGTSNRTKTNAKQLMEALRVDAREISITAAVLQHFQDIGHDAVTPDVTFENSQARERTQILMDLANQLNGLVVGTGDLSEAALGWCTFNGDHMSMYHVNIGVPKTLVRYLVEWCADELFSEPVSSTLRDIVATPSSPELLPVDADGSGKHHTEELVGPYELHDFFLYYGIRCGFSPEKITALAIQAFEGTYSSKEINKWLAVFYRRFFSQQFKRNSMPDGPKVGTLALSPRGDWRMPSDADVQTWLNRIPR